MYWKVSVFFKCVLTSRIDFSLNLVPLYTIVSKNTVSVSDIAAVKFLIFEISIKKISCKDREIKKKNPAGLEQLKKISSSLKILQTPPPPPPHQKSNGPPLMSSSVYLLHFYLDNKK